MIDFALRTYRWSSLSALTGARETPPWLSTGTLSDPHHDSSRLLDYVLLPQPADTGNLEPVFTCDDIEEAIGGRSADLASLLTAETGKLNEQRTLLITLAIELRAASVLELADRYHVDPQSIRRAARRGRVAAATESEFARQRDYALWVLRHSRAA